MEVEEATAKFLEEWGLALFGAFVGSLGLLWLVAEELRFRLTIDARRRKKLKALLQQLVAALEEQEAKEQLDRLRSTCQSSAEFDVAKAEIIGRLMHPIYMKLGVDYAWQEACLPAAAAKDDEIAHLGQKLGVLCSFGLLGPLEAEKGTCVVLKELEGEGEKLNGEKGVLKAYLKEEEVYEISLILKDVGPLAVKLPAANITLLGEKDVLDSIQEQAIRILSEEAVQAVLNSLRAECATRSLYLHRREGVDSVLLNPIFERHGVDSKWFVRMIGRYAGDHAEVRERAHAIEGMLSYTAGVIEEEPPISAQLPQRAPVQRPPLAERSRVKPDGQIWRVTPTDDAGLPVHIGSDESGWAELPNRLEAGVLLREVARSGEYLQLEKLTGKGPCGGWVSLAGLTESKEKPLAIWFLCLNTREDFHAYAALGQCLQRAGYAVRIFGPHGHEELSHGAGLPFSPVCSALEVAISLLTEVPEALEGCFADFMFEDFDHELFMHELERGRPDLLLSASRLGQFWALNAERKFGVPVIDAHLQPRGLEGCVPGFSEEACIGSNYRAWELQCHMEELRLRPEYEVSASRDMGFERFFKRSCREGQLVGFLSSLGDFLHTLPLEVKEIQQRHSCAGFWFLGDEPSLLQGREATVAAVEHFLGAGPAVCIGWGSCVCPKGAHHMVALAVGSLKLAGVRGIVLRGSAGLSPELLSEALGGEDREGLREYAQHNILFIDDLPYSWLLPRCMCHVHPGSASALASSWRSGKPVIVTPIWANQFSNASLVGSMCGIATPSLDELSAADLSNFIKRAMTDLGVEGTARMLSISVQNEDGLQKAVKYINKFLKEELKRWQKRWKATGYGWRDDWGMQRYL